MGAAADEPRLMTSREAAELLGVCVATIRRAVREGGLPAVRLRPRGTLLFSRSVIDQILYAGHPLVGGAVGPVMSGAPAAGATSGGGVGEEPQP
jgi:excisionase family DNA binding protein